MRFLCLFVTETNNFIFFRFLCKIFVFSSYWEVKETGKDAAMTDRELLEQLNSDPNAALRTLTAEYGGVVFSVVSSVLRGCPEKDVEECVSDVFTDFYFRRDLVDLSRGSIKAYVCTMAKHSAIDLLRKYGGKRTLPLDEGFIEPDATPEQKLLDDEKKAALCSAVAALGTPDREIIVRKYYLCQSAKEIAAKLGMTVDNVNVRSTRALGKLRAALAGGEEE